MENPSPQRIAIVTGANKGIGLEICKQLLDKGVKVVLTARDETRGKAAVKKLQDEGAKDVVFHQVDVTDTASIASLKEFILSQFGRLDILVNNAAIGGFDLANPIDEKLPQPERAEIFENSRIQSYEKTVDCLETNYYGVKHMMEAFLPLLQLSNSGRIVNVSSNVGQLKNLGNQELRRELDDIDNLTVERIDDLTKSFLKSVKDNLAEENGWNASYVTSKILMNACTRIFAKNYPSVTINCVNPGFVKTDLNFNTGALTVREGAEGPVMVALAEGGPTGQFYDRTQISTF